MYMYGKGVREASRMGSLYLPKVPLFSSHSPQTRTFFYSINAGKQNPKTKPAIAMKLRLRAVKITAAAFVAAVPAVSTPEWIPST